MSKKHTFSEKKEALAELDENILLADGFDGALIGYVEIFNKTVALYDKDKCLKILMQSGMSYDEAVEYFEYNVTGAYVGEYTPAFATIFSSSGHS
jgi:hypothetical protein